MQLPKKSPKKAKVNPLQSLKRSKAFKLITASCINLGQLDKILNPILPKTQFKFKIDKQG